MIQVSNTKQTEMGELDESSFSEVVVKTTPKLYNIIVLVR